MQLPCLTEGNGTIFAGVAEEAGRPGDYLTNVCCMEPGKPADAISEVLNST